MEKPSLQKLHKSHLIPEEQATGQSLIGETLRTHQEETIIRSLQQKQPKQLSARKDPTSFESANEEARERYSQIQEYLREKECQKHILWVDIKQTSLLTDPTLSPFAAATISPSFTEPCQPTPQSESTPTTTDSQSNEPSPDQPGQEEEELEYQLEQVEIDDQKPPEQPDSNSPPHLAIQIAQPALKIGCL